MEEWKEYRLGELCDTISDTYKGGAQEVVLINTSDVLDGKCLNHQKVANENLKGQFKKTFQYNDILYSEIRPANKRFAFVDFEATDYIASTKLMVLRHNEKITPQYLYYILKSQNVIDELQMLAESRSGTFPQITFSELSNLKVPLPNIKTQNKIISILSSLDDKIEVNRRINEQLEELAQALFNKMFFENNELERLPLSNFANINPTRTLSKGTEARYVEMANLPTKGSFPMDWSLKSYEGGMKFTNGDTIMARITPCLENGKTAYIDFLDENEVAFGSTEYIVISAKEDFCPALFYFLARNNEFVDYAVSHMNGSSGRQRVSGADIANFLMPNISTENSNRFAEVAMPIMDVIRNNSLENRHLTALRDTLLPKLMSGEIDVNDVAL